MNPISTPSEAPKQGKKQSRRGYLSDYRDWMSEKGRLDHEGIPQEPLSPRTVDNRLKKVRRVLVDLGYIGSKELRYNRFKYTYLKDIREITSQEYEGWFSEKFAKLNGNKDRERKNDYVDAVYKFSQFMHHYYGYWDKQQLEELYQKVKRVWIAPLWENKVEIIDLEKTDAFIQFIKKRSPTHYMVVYFMRHAGLRYLEVINARADLKSGTVIEDFKNNRIIVWGKGKGGLSQQRTVPFFEDDIKELTEYIEWRKEKGIKSEWLFVNQYGDKFSEHSQHFNFWLQDNGKLFGQFDTKELKLLTTHKIGRHSYATNCTIKGIPERFICDNMGIRNPNILCRYQNAQDKIRIEETRKRLKGEPKSAVENNGDNKERKRRLVDMLVRGEITQDTFLIAINSF